MEKVLILGSTGMLGHVLYNYLESNTTFKLYDLSYRKKLNNLSILLDVSNTEKLTQLIEEISPNYVINCIGILKKKSIENPKNAIYINAYFPHLLKNICNKINSKLIHVSTDCVFSGNNGNYVENSKKDANDLYGQTKSLGEFNDENHLCIRTSIIGPELKEIGEGLLHWLFNQKGEIQGFKNVFWGGVTTFELSKAIYYSIENNISGIWNLTNGQSISKYDLLKTTIKAFSLHDIELKTDLTKSSNKSLKSIRNINYLVPTYQKMLEELMEYYKTNRDQYNYLV